MPRTRIAVTIGEITKLVKSITPETMAGNRHLEHEHARILRILEDFERLNHERDFHAAQKQEATRKINELVEEGRRLATLVRDILRNEIGPREEKLVAHGIQPFRGRKRARKASSAGPDQTTTEGDPSA
jgi:hypothetical protein